MMAAMTATRAGAMAATLCAGLAGMTALVGCSHKSASKAKPVPEAGSAAGANANTNADTPAPAPAPVKPRARTASPDGLLPHPASAPTGSVRMVIVRGGELLGSEKRAIQDLTHALGKKVGVLTVVGARPSGAEATAGLAVLGDATPARIPATWSAAQTVVILQLLPPSGAKPNRVSRGVGGIAVLRPPSATPIYVERVTGDGLGEPLSADMADWIAGVATLAGGKS